MLPETFQINPKKKKSSILIDGLTSETALTRFCVLFFTKYQTGTLVFYLNPWEKSNVVRIFF